MIIKNFAWFKSLFEPKGHNKKKVYRNQIRMREKRKALELTLVYAFIFMLFVGPWTCGIGRILGLHVFSEISVHEMALYLIKRVPNTFLRGIIPFIAVPVTLIFIRWMFPKMAFLLREIVFACAMMASICGIPLLFMPLETYREEPNPMGRVLAADLIFMWMVHLYFCIHEILPPLTIVYGPLFGMCMFLKSPQKCSVHAAIAVLYASMGALYEAYNDLPEEHATFVQTTPLAQWRSIELYGAISVVGGVLVLCVSIIPPRSCTKCMQIFAYIILLNANVASAWMAASLTVCV